MYRKIVCIACMCMLLTAACGQPDTGTAQVSSTSIPQAAPESNQRPKVIGAGYVEYATFESLQELMDQSDVIVIGEVVGTGSMFNSSRDLDDSTKSSSTTFSVGQIYHLQVQRYLKGTGSDMLYLAQTEGQILASPNAVTSDDIRRARDAWNATIPFQKGVPYLLFLRDLTKYYQNDISEMPLYGENKEPSRFELLPDGRAKIEAPQEAMRVIPADFFPDGIDAPLLPQVEQLVQKEQSNSATP